MKRYPLNGWLKTLPERLPLEEDLPGILKSAFYLHVINTQQKFYAYSVEEIEIDEELFQTIETNWFCIKDCVHDDKRFIGVFINQDGLLQIFYSGGDTYSVSAFSKNEKEIIQLKELLSKKEEQKQQGVFTLLTRYGDLHLSKIGEIDSPLIESNYAPSVIDGMKHVVEDLKKQTPCGRLIIFDGPPGTGKTYCVQSLLSSGIEALFILIPSGTLNNNSIPKLLELLTEKKDEDGRPIVLIIEDADEYLAARASDNLSTLTALLNFTAGIYADVLNIRVICTTNAPIEALDSAVTRASRLCRRIEVPLLSWEQANTVYTRLTNRPGPYKKGFYSLAEVYKETKDPGTASVIKPKGRVGF